MIRILLAILLPLMFISCSKVPAGHVGVRAFLLGSEKGVDHEVLGTGRYWIGFNEELFLFPTFQQNKVWTQDVREDSPVDESFTFQTKEGMQVNTDLGITYSIDEKEASSLFKKYRRGIEEITSVFLRNHVRDALNKVASSMNVESVYGEGKIELIEKATDMVKNDLKDTGINVEKLYIIGALRLPNTVIEALNAKIEATQRAQQRENELREAEAQARKQIAEAEGKAKSMLAIAEAEAKANSLKQKTLTQELIQYEAIQRWNGKLPKMTGGGALPFINIK